MTTTTLVRPFIPEAVLNLRRYIEDRWTLSKAPRCQVDPSLLPALTAADIAGALAAVPGSEWRAVQDWITPHLPHEDPGSALPDERRALYALMRWRAPDWPLEIGTWLGVSTAYLAAAIYKENTLLTTVDIAQTRSATMLLAAAGLRDQTCLIQSNSLDFLASAGPRFDFVFIDGNHRAGHVYRELVAVVHRLARDGLVVLHDINPGGIPFALQKVLRGPCLAVKRLRRECGVKMLQVLPGSSLAVLSR